MRFVLILAAAALVSEACGPTCKTPKSPPSYAATVEPDIVIPKCQTCHSKKKSGAARKAAPDSTNYDTYDEMLAIYKTAMERVDSTSQPMPPTSENIPLTAAEKEEFDQWALCGAAP
jgi:uncharacterized membrane protein